MYTNNLDNKQYYSTIRENLVNNFFKRYYQGSVVSMKELVIADMKFRCSFEIQPIDNSFESINIILEKDNHLIIHLKWEEKIDKVKIYKLVSIE